MLLSVSGKSVFSGCYVSWSDVLTFISNKTDFTKQQTHVKLVQKRTPSTFSHRMPIQFMNFLPQLGCLYTVGRDGLIHLWADEQPSK